MPVFFWAEILPAQADSPWKKPRNISLSSTSASHKRNQFHNGWQQRKGWSWFFTVIRNYLTAAIEITTQRQKLRGCKLKRRLKRKQTPLFLIAPEAEGLLLLIQGRKIPTVNNFCQFFQVMINIKQFLHLFFFFFSSCFTPSLFWCF